MKGAAQGFCRPRARRTISRTLELGRHPGACSSCALRGGRASGTGSKPDSSDHRCAERKGCPWLDPSGDDAAKRGRRDGPPVERGRSSRDVQDRDGAFQLLRRARRLLPWRICRKQDALVVCARMAVAHHQAFRCCRLRGLAQTLGSSTNFFAWISRNRRLAWLVTLNATPQPS